MFLGQFKGPSFFELQKTGFNLYGQKKVAGFRGRTLPKSCMEIRYGTTSVSTPLMSGLTIPWKGLSFYNNFFLFIIWRSFG